MKNTTFKLAGTLLVSFLIMSCSKTETSNTPSSLKEAISSSTLTLNNAIADIASTQAFQLLSVNGGVSLKSGTTSTTSYGVYIPMDLVKGVYDYKPLKTTESRGYNLIRFYTKSTDAGKMVVNMPLAKLKDPHVLREYLPADSTQTNNFSMTVTDYHNNYNNYHDYDYVNVADISIDKASAGSLNIKSVVSPTLGTNYASQFAFSNGYTAKYAYASGDTTKSSFTLLKATTILYKEELLTIKKDTGRFGHEQLYTLTIGDVKLIRKADKTYEVYVKNVLQPKAVVAMVDKVSTTEPSICHQREIQITFEDGTISTLSTLMNNSITNISTLFTSLHDVYFAAYVVDWLAYDVYYKRN